MRAAARTGPDRDHRRRTALTTWEGPLSRRSKATLAGEILVSYAVARRAMRSNQLLPAVTHVRSSGRTLPPVPDTSRTAAARHLASAVNRVVRRLPTDSRCLARALTLSRCLARRNIPATLILGVRVEPEFAAHAWVELDGRALLPPGDAKMRRLVEV